jgi:hypothetical protein
LGKSGTGETSLMVKLAMKYFEEAERGGGGGKGNADDKQIPWFHVIAEHQIKVLIFLIFFIVLLFIFL